MPPWLSRLASHQKNDEAFMFLMHRASGTHVELFVKDGAGGNIVGKEASK